MKHRNWIYLGLIFIAVTVIFGVETVILVPFTPEYFDPENIYSFLTAIFMTISFLSGVGAGACFLWWAWSKHFSTN